MCFTSERTEEGIFEKLKNKVVLGCSPVFFLLSGLTQPQPTSPLPPHFLLQYGFSDNQEREEGGGQDRIISYTLYRII